MPSFSSIADVCAAIAVFPLPEDQWTIPQSIYPLKIWIDVLVIEHFAVQDIIDEIKNLNADSGSRFGYQIGLAPQTSEHIERCITSSSSYHLFSQDNYQEQFIHCLNGPAGPIFCREWIDSSSLWKTSSAASPHSPGCGQARWNQRLRETLCSMDEMPCVMHNCGSFLDPVPPVHAFLLYLAEVAQVTKSRSSG